MVEGHEFVMGEFSPNLLINIILHHIWPKVCAIPSWPNQMLLCFTLCIINKSWKDLVDGSQDWAHYKFHLLELQF